MEIRIELKRRWRTSVKSYIAKLPDSWKACSRKESYYCIKLFIFEKNLVHSGRKYLQKVSGWPKHVVKRIIRIDLLLAPLEFCSEEPPLLKQMPKRRIGLCRGPGVLLQKMNVREYFWAQTLCGKIDQELKQGADVTEYLRLLAGCVYRSRIFLRKKDNFWKLHARCIRRKELWIIYFGVVGCMRNIKINHYPYMHMTTNSGKSKYISQDDAQNLINSVAGEKFGDRRKAEKYTILEVFPEMERVAKYHEKLRRKAAAKT